MKGWRRDAPETGQPGRLPPRRRSAHTASAAPPPLSRDGTEARSRACYTGMPGRRMLHRMPDEPRLPGCRHIPVPVKRRERFGENLPVAAQRIKPDFATVILKNRRGCGHTSSGGAAGGGSDADPGDRHRPEESGWCAGARPAPRNPPCHSYACWLQSTLRSTHGSAQS